MKLISTLVVITLLMCGPAIGITPGEVITINATVNYSEGSATAQCKLVVVNTTYMDKYYYTSKYTSLMNGLQRVVMIKVGQSLMKFTGIQTNRNTILINGVEVVIK